MPLNALPHLIHPFVLVILVVKENKSFFELKEKMSHHTRAGGGGGERNVTKCHIGKEGGSKKSGKSVTYYLIGPSNERQKNEEETLQKGKCY